MYQLLTSLSCLFEGEKVAAAPQGKRDPTGLDVKMDSEPDGTKTGDFVCLFPGLLAASIHLF